MAYGSPVFAAQNVLQDLLVQQAATKRQAFLDAQNSRKVDADIANQNENTASMRDERQARSALLAQQAQDALGKTLSVDQPIDDATAAKLPPSWVRPKITGESGATVGNPIITQSKDLPASPTVGDVESNVTGPGQLGSFAPNTRPALFRGDPKQQDEIATRGRVMELLQSKPFQDADSKTQAMMYDNTINNRGAISAAIMADPKQPGRIIHSKNGVDTLNGEPFTGTTTPTDHIVKDSNPPQGPQTKQAVWGNFTDDGNGNKVPNLYIVDRANGTYRLATPAEAVTAPPNPNAPPKAASGPAPVAGQGAAPIVAAPPQGLGGKPVSPPKASTAVSKYIQPGDEADLRKTDFNISSATTPDDAAPFIKYRKTLVDKIKSQWQPPADSTFDLKKGVEFMLANQYDFSFDQLLGAIKSPDMPAREVNILIDMFKLLKDPGTK